MEKKIDVVFHIYVPWVVIVHLFSDEMQHTDACWMLILFRLKYADCDHERHLHCNCTLFNGSFLGAIYCRPSIVPCHLTIDVDSEYVKAQHVTQTSKASGGQTEMS